MSTASTRGDTTTALAACAAHASILDEFPPSVWRGATACSDWSIDCEADSKTRGITDPLLTLGTPQHLEITGARAYVVVLATYTDNQHGKPVAETGSLLTVALQKVAAGWRITGWAWAKR